MSRVAGERAARSGRAPVVSLPKLQVFAIACAYVLISTPQALNFMRVLPILCPIFLIALAVIGRRREQLSRLRIGFGFILFGMWSALSVIWSENRVITVVQTLSTVLALIIGLIVGHIIRLDTLVKGIAFGGCLVVAISLVLALVLPSQGLQLDGYQGGALRGIYVQRNVLAGVLAPAFVAALSRVGHQESRLWSSLGAVGLIAVGILLTRSSTALAVSLAALIIVLGCGAARVAPARTRLYALLIIGALFGSALVGLVLNPDTLFLALGRDETLTGRVVIWKAVGELIATEPWLGFGWGAAWGVDGYVQRFVEAQAKFTVPHAHNGYLNILIQVGIPGLVLFLFPILQTLSRSIRHLVDTRTTTASVLIALPICVLLYNYSEPTMESPLILSILAALWGAAARAPASDDSAISAHHGALATRPTP